MQIRPRRNLPKSKVVQVPDGERSLAELKEGTKGIITRAAGTANVVRRLSDMGLTPGCEVKLIRKCSFHGPIEVEVRGVALALGYQLASEVYIHPLKEP
jgi:ferrous iron transport protein A